MKLGPDIEQSLIGLSRVRPKPSGEKRAKGSADLEFLDNEKLVIIPMMMDGKVTAHRID